MGRGELHGQKCSTRSGRPCTRRQRRDGKRHGISQIHPRMPARAKADTPDRIEASYSSTNTDSAGSNGRARTIYPRPHLARKRSCCTNWTAKTNLRVMAPHAVGPYSGRLLEMLVRMLRPRRCSKSRLSRVTRPLHGRRLEGGRTAYRRGGDELEELAQSFFDRSAHGSRIRLHIGSALDIAPGLGGVFDLVFIDGDSANTRTTTGC